MQQYYFYLDKVLMPVTPASLELKIGNQNKRYDLANGREINIINPPGLTSISFELLLPTSEYPFGQYAGEFKDAGYYLEHLEKLKTSGQPFEFMVIRTITAELALKFSANLLGYSAEMANTLTGRKDGRIKSSDARILLRGENRYIADTTMTVTLEEYKIIEDAEKYGRDFCVSVELLQYNNYGVKTVVFAQS